MVLLESGLVKREVVLLLLVEEGGSLCRWCSCSCCSCLVEAGVELEFADESWWPGAAGVDLKRSHIVAIGNEGSPSLARESS